SLWACSQSIPSARTLARTHAPLFPCLDSCEDVILYVPDVEATVTFYEKAFGLKRRFVAPGDYGELDTGATALGFASEALAESNGTRFRRSRPSDAESPAAEVAFVIDDPRSAFDQAVRAGATPLKEATRKPWGQ